MRIARLMIERFRGLEFLAWEPSAGLNCLIGPSDAGKTTTLAAIELLLAPWQPVAFEFDYWRRRVDAGFRISAVLVDPPEEFIASFRVPPLHGWMDGKLTHMPERGAAPALVAVVRGLPDLEIEHVLLEPAGEEIRFGAGHRRQLRMTRLNWDRTDVELRLSKGSLLQQHLGGQSMRSALTGALAGMSERVQLPSDVSDRLKALSEHYLKSGLPNELQLGLQSPRRESLLGLLGLLEGPSHDEAIPLALAGAGTKRFAAFELAAALGVDAQILLVDEPELGLEPYRQRKLVARLRELIGSTGQGFLTTHSAAVLAGMKSGELARFSRGRCPVALPSGVDKLLADDCEAMLARLPILCEGKTEAGALAALLTHVGSFRESADLDAMGIRLVTRTGQPAILRGSVALAKAGIEHGLFVDNENEHSGTRMKLAADPKVAFGTWRTVRNIEAAVAAWLSDAQVESLISLAAGLNNCTVDALRRTVGEKAGAPGNRCFRELAAHVGEDRARAGLADAMNVRGWFKSVERGFALGQFLVGSGLPAPVRTVVDEFWERLRPFVQQ